MGSPARTGSRSGGRGKSSSAKSGRAKWLTDLPFLVLLTLVIAALIRTFLVQPFYIPSGSMEQTLFRGDRVLVDKVSYRFGDIQRGDVVVFNGLDSFSPEVAPQPPGNLVQRGLRAVAAAVGLAAPGQQDFIKRVIGIPGDHVRCCDEDGLVTVNGEPIDETDYLFAGNAPSDTTFDVRVPAGRLWVMGDHRERSADSRSHLGDPGGGTVPEDKVIGRAFSVVWPVSRFSGIGRPDAFEGVQPASAGSRAAPPATPLASSSPPAAPLVAGFVIALPCLLLRRQARSRGGGTAR